MKSSSWPSAGRFGGSSANNLRLTDSASVPSHRSRPCRTESGPLGPQSQRTWPGLVLGLSEAGRFSTNMPESWPFLTKDGKYRRTIIELCRVLTIRSRITRKRPACLTHPKIIFSVDLAFAQLSQRSSDKIAENQHRLGAPREYIPDSGGGRGHRTSPAAPGDDTVPEPTHDDQDLRQSSRSARCGPTSMRLAR